MLLLGSYDATTKKILRNVRNNLNESFTRYSCYTILLENLDVFVSTTIKEPSYFILLEREEEEISCTILSSSTKIIETLMFKNQEAFNKYIGHEARIIDYGKFRKMSELSKIKMLDTWADLVYVIRDKEETRGGELVELTYLLHNRSEIGDPGKYAIFYRKGISISTMLKEIIGMHRVATIDYVSEVELVDKFIENIGTNIDRLNVQFNRFLHFEMM